MTESEVLGLFDQWNAALATLDPDAVTALYTENGILLPTVSNQVRHNPEEIRDYFVAFLKKSPQGKIDEANVRILSDTHATNSGVYTFTFGDGSTVTARFSYLYVQTDGGWKIMQHHSSAMPEG
ncbi:MAG: SgcJ/EcaC family oxidoreductase [Pseudomonadota bacterium]|nr:SgcJ/EcaC family oxidoreductase [Pseudomonadota bacterium]MED5443703.1 SgcJ/EcaC family oxidoreductase [Pseudomonadota bacterium]MEE3110201.1 SgcJ/EcaC family oxidoreductase [Pseudomonadota bacterium]